MTTVVSPSYFTCQGESFLVPQHEGLMYLVACVRTVPVQNPGQQWKGASRENSSHTPEPVTPWAGATPGPLVGKASNMELPHFISLRYGVCRVRATGLGWECEELPGKGQPAGGRWGLRAAGPHSMGGQRSCCSPGLWPLGAPRVATWDS